MSKRSDFPKVDKDWYPTRDPAAIVPKFVEFIRGKAYAEPCYGNGDLEDLLMDVATCKWRSDVRSTVGCSKVMDGLEITTEDLKDCDCFCTNPPFSQKVLRPLLDHWLTFDKDIWLLLPADYMHNIWFGPYMKVCSKVVSIGRLVWFYNEWVDDLEVKLTDDLKPWVKDKLKALDYQKGIGYYSGWVNSKGVPMKTRAVKSTENHAWYCFNGRFNGNTIFYGR